VELANPTGGAIINADYGEADVAITDDDTSSISINDVSVTEGNIGTTPVTFRLNLSTPADHVITVDYATADDTALAPSDYQAGNGTLTFAPGETIKDLTLRVTDDRLGEPNETFLVNLSNPTNATITDGQAVGTIVDNEPRISISDVSKKEGNGKKTTSFSFTVTLSAAYDQPVTVSFRTLDGTATTSDGDYIAKTGTITFAPGETSKILNIEVKADT